MARSRPSHTPGYRLHRPSGQAVVTLNGMIVSTDIRLKLTLSDE